MRILVVGATGTIGQAVVAALRGRHDVVEASRTKAALTVDITNAESIAALFKHVGKIDAIVSSSGSARFAPLDKITGDDFTFSLNNKLMGQVNLARAALEHINEGGSITLTSGVLAWNPMPGSAAISVVNGGVEGFAAAAAVEAPRSIRVNVVSPPWVTETLQAMKMQMPDHRSAADVAQLYVTSIEGKATGHVIGFTGGAKGDVRSVPMAQR